MVMDDARSTAIPAEGQVRRSAPTCGPSGGVHKWSRRDLLARIWALLVEIWDEGGGLDWQWQAADTAMGQARRGATGWAATRVAIVVERALPTEEKPQPRCLDKGNDHPLGLRR